jgi:hypothetical protein
MPHFILPISGYFVIIKLTLKRAAAEFPILAVMLPFMN